MDNASDGLFPIYLCTFIHEFVINWELLLFNLKIIFSSIFEQRKFKKKLNKLNKIREIYIMAIKAVFNYLPSSIKNSITFPLFSPPPPPPSLSF